MSLVWDLQTEHNLIDLIKNCNLEQVHVICGLLMIHLWRKMLLCLCVSSDGRHLILSKNQFRVLPRNLLPRQLLPSNFALFLRRHHPILLVRKPKCWGCVLVSIVEEVWKDVTGLRFANRTDVNKFLHTLSQFVFAYMRFEGFMAERHCDMMGFQEQRVVDLLWVWFWKEPEELLCFGKYAMLVVRRMRDSK